MGKNVEEKVDLHDDFKLLEIVEGDLGAGLVASPPKSSIQEGSRPMSMVIKKAHTVIPAHLIAEAISTLHGCDLRWSGPITPNERLYVQQYVFAKYPEYNNGLVEESDKVDLYSLCSLNDANEDPSTSEKNSPKRELNSPNFGNNPSDNVLDGTQLEPSRLLQILTKKASIHGNFISIPEIQVRNRALQHCGLTEDDYLVIFTNNLRESMIMVGESYPFFRGSYYMAIIDDEDDHIREFALMKDSKVVAAPKTWLDLRIKGSQLSQYFRRKCKYCPKGLFVYPVCAKGERYSMHWISEAHRNQWHVLLDATGLESGKDRLTLAMHRPDFVVCEVDSTSANAPQPAKKITCLLVRRRSFDTGIPSP